VEGSPQAFGFSFQKSLRILGIGFVDSLKTIQTEFNTLAKRMESSQIDSLRETAKSASLNFAKIGLNPLSRPIEKLNLPPVFLNDLSQHQFQKNENELKTFDLEKNYTELVDLQIRCENFAEACI
jgi:hypothetical protein